MYRRMPQYRQCPPRIFPTQYDPVRVSPTQNFVRPNIFPRVVKHFHPTHTTNVNRHVITHQHFFPHTESVVNEVVEQHVMYGRPQDPCGRRRPYGY